MDASEEALRQDLVYRFAGFALDPGCAALLGPDGDPIRLRPKSFELLCRLVAGAGTLVTREALLRTVRAGVTVTDESITQCVRDIRQALGEAGPRLVRTVPKRGYLLAAEVAAAPAATAGPAVAAHLPEAVAAGAPPPPPGAAPPGAAPPGGDRASRRRWPERPAQVALLLLGIGLAGGGMAAWRDGAKATFSAPAPSGPAPRCDAAADPGFGPAWSALAFTYINMVGSGHSVNPAEDLRAAEVAAERGLAFAPENSDAHSALGSVLAFRPERLEDAVAAYRRALELSPTSHPLRANMGWLLVRLGRAGEGEVLLRTTLAGAPSDHPFRAGWHYQLGMARLLLGPGAAGVEDLRRGPGGDGNGARAQAVALAGALAIGGQAVEAAQLLAEARQRWPGLSLAVLRSDASWFPQHEAYRERWEALFGALAALGLSE